MFGRASMEEEGEDEVAVSSTASAALFNRESRLFASHLFRGGVDRLGLTSVATDSDDSLSELVVDDGDGDLDTKARSAAGCSCCFSKEC